MNYIEHEFHNQGYDSVDIFYGNDFIKTIKFNDQGFLGDQNQKTYVDYKFNIEGNDLILTIDLSASNILIVIEDENIENYINDSFDLNDFDFALNFEDEETQISLQIPFYMPTITYTNLASSIVYDVDHQNVIPLFDVDSLERFESYQNDEIITFNHFLDLEFSDKVANQEMIDQAVSQRKEEKKVYGQQVTVIPEKNHQKLTNSEIIDSYNRIENKSLVIPVLNWDRDENIIDDIIALDESFEYIALRVSSSYGRFVDFIETLKERFTNNLDDFYIIFDMNNNFALEQYQAGIISTSKVFNKVIYLGAQVSASDISKARGSETNINHIFNNKPLEIFESLSNIASQEESNIYGYGDYCGFDRKSISRSKGGRPTARVVLTSVDKCKKMLVRRAWEEEDSKKDSKGNELSTGLIHSMNRLMFDIQNGELDQVSGIVFLDPENYDTDEALKEFYPQRPAAGLLKTICLRHNYLSIVKNFMPIQNS